MENKYNLLNKNGIQKVMNLLIKANIIISQQILKLKKDKYSNIVKYKSYQLIMAINRKQP